MRVNLHLTGDLEAFVNELIERGIAANKTEAIRLAIARMYFQEEKHKFRNTNPLNQSAIEAHWNNPSDEKSSEFYSKRYKDDKKA